MSRTLLTVALLVVAAVVYVVVQVARPAPSVTAVATAPSTSNGTTPNLAWPSQGEAAFGVEGEGVLASHGSDTPTPLGSVTKIMTAYVLLHDHPLKAGTQGPEITVTPADAATYQSDKAATDSVVPVVAGEQLTELQALEAMLIPSGDNIAAMLATWDAGNEQAFVAKMNADAKALGLTHTHYVDVSGVQPGTKSTAADQTRLAMAAMTLPAFRSVVSMAQVTLPLAGLQYNVNALLGTDNIIGVKTGFITQAGGCFVFAATTTVGTTKTTVVGAVLHQLATPAQPSALQAAFDATTTLLPTIEGSLTELHPMTKGQTLARLEAPWATPVPLQAAKSLSTIGLSGEAVHTSVHLPAHVSAPVTDGQRIGTAVVSVGGTTHHVPLVAAGSMPGVSTGWRLTDI